MELYSILTHLVPAIFFIGIGIVEITKNKSWDILWRTHFYMFTIITLGVSSINHMMPIGSDSRDITQMIDYTAIFCMLAASFSSIHGVMLIGFGGWGVAIFSWALALFLITVKLIYVEAVSYWVWVSVYLVLGWFGFFSVKKLIEVYSLKDLTWIIIGGILYSTGAIFEIIGLHHALFHIFVVGGMGSHWYFISKVSKRISIKN